jgi:EmrB/QacA subfamily drug resistance transporter
VERRWKVLAVTSVAVYIALLDVTIVNIASPSMLRSFVHDSLVSLSWVLNAYNIVFAAALVPAGRLADRLGRRRVFLTGLMIFLVASLACSLAPTVPFLVAARALQAVGAAVVVPTSLGLILPLFPVAQRATATALWTATGAIAAATGPALGGVLVQLAGWRWIFVVNLVIGPPTAVIAARMLTESRDETTGRWPDGLGAGVLALGLACLALGLVKGPDWGWMSAGVLASLAVAAALLVLFAFRTLHHPAPVVEPALLRIRSFAVANAGSLLFGIGFNAMLLCNVLFLTTVWQYSLLKAGAAMTVGPVAAAFTAPFAGRLGDRLGPRAAAAPGGMIMAASALLLAAGAGSRPDYTAVLLPATVLAGVGLGLALPAFGAAAVAEVPHTRYATAVAVTSCCRQLGAVLGVAMLVAVLHTGSAGASLAAFHRAYLLIALSGVSTAAAGVALGRVRVREVASFADGTPSPHPAEAG